jgi:hypothetical protein
MRSARSRTGLNEQQVVDLLTGSGYAIDAATLRRWESTGRIELASAARLADIYGTTLDNLAGRRSYKRHPPNVDLAVPPGDAR